MKMVWKEWRQQRLLFLLFCAAGIIFPVYDGFTWWRINGYFFSDIGFAVVLGFGALFAILLSIATTNSDVKKGVDNFLLSRPIGAYRIFVSKVVLAAVLLWITFMFVSSLDFVSGSTHNRSVSPDAWTAICYAHPAAIMLFSVTMLLVVVLRDTAKAALVAIWAALMMYFLPLLLGSLRWMNIFEQMDNTYNRPSVVRYLLLVCSLREKAGSTVPMYRSGDIPVLISKTKWLQGLLSIFSSPVYLQYLLFVAVTTAVSIACVVLSVKAMKNRWRWRPGQKTIVWLIGLSAAFIFGVSMLQVGHNLEPITELEGKRIVNPAQFGWNYMPAKLNEGLPEGEWIGVDTRWLGTDSDAVCFKDDLMFRVTCGFQGKKGQVQFGWDDEFVRHFVLQIYRFPFKENNKADTEYTPDFVVGAMRFFETEPVKRGRASQRVLGCFIREDRLYAAYRPMSKKNKNGAYPSRLNPFRFLTVDVSNPAEPKVISDLEILHSDYKSGSFAHFGQYCYINDTSQLLIISVEEPDEPKIVSRITADELVGKPKETEPGATVEKRIWFPGRRMSIVDDKMICGNEFRIVMFNLADPLRPEVIYDESFMKKGYTGENGIKALLYKDGLIYLASRKGIFIRKLVTTDDDSYTSELIGQRKATPIEVLAGRRPSELLFYNGYLVEGAWRFGVLVYDVSNPSRPRRVFHAQTNSLVSDIGIWNGLMYMQGYAYKLTFPDIPKAK